MKQSLTKTIGAAIAAGFVATAANASYVPAFGTYSIENAYPNHGLYFFDELVDTNSDGLTGHVQRWSTTSGTLEYIDGGGAITDNELKINGVFSQGGYQLQVNFSMNQIADGGRDPYCGGGNACQLSADGTQDKYDGVQFFDFASATISGLGDLAGLVYELTVKPNGLAKPPQFGSLPPSAIWFIEKFTCS